MQPQPFKIAIAEDAITDLHNRLNRTRWLTGIEGQGWSEGTDLAFLQSLITYWADTFDWRTQESQLNQLPHYLAQVHEQTVHFIHQPGTGPAPMPLILTHGWPGSFVEMQRLIPLLADPASHGGDAADAFHVVVPSLPGYAFSPAPQHKGVGPYEVAGLWAALMQGLGYARFGAQGGDLGAGVSTWLGRRFPDQVSGIHLNYVPGSYRPPLDPDPPPITADEQAFLDRSATFADAEGAYARLHGTKPQSLAIGLNDSPAGLAAWLVEKFQAWTDCSGDLQSAVSLDALLTNISVYWFTGSIGSSLRPYVEGRNRPLSFAAGERVQPPTGVALFPAELPMPPRSWVERCFDVQRWTTMPKGGHFAAMEQPQLLAEDIRAFFRPLR